MMFGIALNHKFFLLIVYFVQVSFLSFFISFSFFIFFFTFFFTNADENDENGLRSEARPLVKSV